MKREAAPVNEPTKPDVTSDSIRRSTRDRDEMRPRLQAWLAERHPGAAVNELVTPSNGMSSETLLFDATWDDAGVPGGRVESRFVARVEPPDEAVPVFPAYDLGLQHRIMSLVATHTDAPVPRVLWAESDPRVLGGEFFVMERVDGDVPPDVLPYTMEGFVLEMDEAQRRRLQDATVDALVEIHRTPLEAASDELDRTRVHTGLGDPDGRDRSGSGGTDGASALRHHFGVWRDYHAWVLGERTSPLLDDALAWLEANWPHAADVRDPVLSWGDARIGNVMYGPDQRPVAVLDWEMAAIAPREVDLGWMSFLHTFFQDITEELGMPGLPDMLRSADIATRYAATSGVEPLELGWFEVYAAYRHGVIMARVHDRQVHFGEAEPVDDPDEAVMHRARLRQMISS